MKITTFEGDIGYIPAFADGSLYIGDGMVWRPNGEYAEMRESYFPFQLE